MSASRKLAVSVCGLWLAASGAVAQNGATGGGWQAYGADTGSTKYTPLDQIHAGNVNDLRVVWRRPALDEYYYSLNPQQRVTPNYISAPIIVDGVGYIPNSVGLVEAFDPGSGATLWVQQPIGGAEDLRGTATRGVAYWSEGGDNRILVQRNTHLYALNAATGQPISSFGDGGRVNLQVDVPDAERFRWGGVPMVIGRCGRYRPGDVGHIFQPGSPARGRARL